MCRINIIHFSHHIAQHHDVFFRPEEAPNSSTSTSSFTSTSTSSFTSTSTSSSSSSSSSSTTSTSTTCNDYHLSNPTNGTIATKLHLPPNDTSRLTEEEDLTSLQRLPPYQFVPCPTHTNYHCVVYKQTMPCFLQRFHSAAAAAVAAAEVNANGDADGDAHSGEGGAGDGVNVATCPNLEITNESHPLRLILEDINNSNDNSNENGKSMPGGSVHTTLSQAKTAVLSTADEIHQQTVEMNSHLLETCSLLEWLYGELAAHTTQATTAQSRASLMQLETPLQRASELCQQIILAEKKISELFRTFLQRRKDMADLLVAIEKKEITDCGAYTYPISKAKQDLRELSVANVREVCAGPIRRGREVSGEVVRLLEGVSRCLLVVE